MSMTSGDLPCRADELPEKNTFIDYPPAPMVEMREIPTKTAPAMLMRRLALRLSNAAPSSNDETNGTCGLGGSIDFGNADSDYDSSTNCPLDSPPPEEREVASPTAEADFLLPSVGSADHSSGTCNPCAWYWKPDGCKNGESCTRCHLCPKGELKMRRKLKEKHLREQARIVADVPPLVEERGSLVEEPKPAQCITQETEKASNQQHADKEYPSLDSMWESCFGEQSECPTNISVKNTFIQVSAVLSESESAFPSEPPTKSAPGALLTRLFRLKPKEGELVSPEGLQKLATEETSLAIVSDAGSTTSRQSEEDATCEFSSDTHSSFDYPETASEDEAVALESHALGQCTPCAYFWYKKDGCRIGENCKFCHLCKKGEIKKRKRDLIRQLKVVGQYVPPTQASQRRFSTRRCSQVSN
jgi:hypothetical protein